MAGEKTRIQSGKQAAEMGRRGGLKSAKVKKERKTMRESFRALLSLDCKNEKLNKAMKGFGVSKSDQDYMHVLCISMMREAMKGNVQAFNSIRDLIGESPAMQMQLTGKNGAPLHPEPIQIEVIRRAEDVDKDESV